MKLIEVEGVRALVKMIRHSVNPAGQNLWTFSLTYPRIIHAEFMTHRKFSRGASSSRAIPTPKLLQMVRNTPAMPVRFGANQKGMRDTGEEHREFVRIPEHMNDLYEVYLKTVHGHTPSGVFPDSAPWDASPEDAWRFSAWLMADMSEAFHRANYHKQIANRLTEFAQYISVVNSTTELDNFFHLRIDSAADPTIYDLAYCMKQVVAQSIAQPVEWGDWHLPYLVGDELSMRPGVVVPYSTARCGRVSYLNHEGKRPTHDEDMDLHAKLLGSDPEHMTPAEHPAIAVPGTYANFDGWCSYRWQREHRIRMIPDDGGWERGRL